MKIHDDLVDSVQYTIASNKRRFLIVKGIKRRMYMRYARNILFFCVASFIIYRFLQLFWILCLTTPIDGSL